MTPSVPSGRSERLRPDPLLRAKLSRPHLGDQVLERERLLAALRENASRRLTLLVGDAGFGKTTLLANYVQSLARPVVWYSLMPSDADPIVFSRYLVEGFRREHPRFGREVERLLEEGRPGSRVGEVLGGTIAGALAALKGPVHLLVLDDFQAVTAEPQVVALTEALLRHLPERVRLLIASRTVPPLALERLRAAGDVFELDSNQLRMTREEQGQLFAEVYGRPISDRDLGELDETTLGWPTAVHLVHESLRRSDKAGLDQVLASFRASSLELHDYLSAEVYARLDASSKRLLEHTAPLARFDAGLAGALAGGTRSSASPAAACCAASAPPASPRTRSTTWCGASCARRSRPRAGRRPGRPSSWAPPARSASAARSSRRSVISCSPAPCARRRSSCATSPRRCCARAAPRRCGST